MSRGTPPVPLARSPSGAQRTHTAGGQPLTINDVPPATAVAVALFAWPLASRPPAPLAHANRREVVVSGCAFATSPIALLGAPARSTAATDGSSWAEHTGPFTDDFFSDFTDSSASPGFKYKILQRAECGKRDACTEEKPVNLQKVFVHYTGYLLDGTKFDSSYTSKDEPFGFRLGKGKVITGWEATVPAMVPGMRLVVRIPPEFAYGDKSVGKIPANSPLIFYMELVKLGNIKSS